MISLQLLLVLNKRFLSSTFHGHFVRLCSAVCHARTRVHLWCHHIRDQLGGTCPLLSITLLTVLFPNSQAHLLVTEVMSSTGFNYPAYDIHSISIGHYKKNKRLCWLCDFDDVVYEIWITLGDPSVSWDYINAEIFIEYCLKAGISLS